MALENNQKYDMILDTKIFFESLKLCIFFAVLNTLFLISEFQAQTRDQRPRKLQRTRL